MVEMHKARLVVGDNIYSGSSEYSHGSYGSMTKSKISIAVSLSSETLVILEHICNKNLGTVGLGLATGFGNAEVYSSIKVTKID